MDTTLPTVTAPETDTCWSITPQGRAALDRAIALADRIEREVTNL